jgi:hypothetical protein
LVLAEDAQNIFDDRYYDDLISFEEDIARAASLIAIIAESPGSLAELGAFSSIPVIADATCVIQQTENRGKRSFITLGPIKRLANKDDGRIGYYPWKKNDGKIFHSTVKPHVRHMANFINGRLDLVEKSSRLRSDADLELMYFVLWIIFLFKEVSTQILYDTVKEIFPDVTEPEIKAKVFSLLVSKWVGLEPYSGKEYYYARFDRDPFLYRFIDARERADRHKPGVVASLKHLERVPGHVASVGRRTREETSR